MAGVSLINKFAASDDVMEPLLAELARHRAVLAVQPGFVNGAVYRQVAGPGRFTVVNMTHWASAEALDAARRVLTDAYAAKGSTPVAEYARLGIEADHSVCVEAVSF